MKLGHVTFSYFERTIPTSSNELVDLRKEIKCVLNLHEYILQLYTKSKIQQINLFRPNETQSVLKLHTSFYSIYSKNTDYIATLSSEK